MVASYPDTLLRDDALDPLYGGRLGTEFGGLAFQCLWNVLRFLEEAHLAYHRQPYRTVAPAVTGAVAPGDVVVVDLSTPTAAGGYRARKAEAGDAASTTIRVLGVCIVGAAVSARAVVATTGLVPRTYTGLATAPAVAPLGVNWATGRLKLAAPGDLVVALADVNGNALLRLGS